MQKGVTIPFVLPSPSYGFAIILIGFFSGTRGNMGTGCLTRVIDDDGAILLVFLRRTDGYPAGHGKEIVDFLQSRKMVLGITRKHDAGECFNGMPDLACQLLAHLKTYNQGTGQYSAPRAGEFYTCSGTHSDEGEYIYTIEGRKPARSYDTDVEPCTVNLRIEVHDQFSHWGGGRGEMSMKMSMSSPSILFYMTSHFG